MALFIWKPRRRADDAQLAPLGLVRYRHLKAGAVHAHLLQKTP